MTNRVKAPDIFNKGSKCLRADFHLHTQADKEFRFNNEGNRFVKDYIEALKEQNIRLGVITNHNKFDSDEFKELRREAQKEEIFLLPGVELFVNDGANGIHTLVIFSDQWLENGNDYISPFITTMFPGKAEIEYQNENRRSDKNILQVVEELDKTGRDYFLIFAHVEQKSGLWCEMRGGKIGDFKDKRYDAVRRRTLGFQKVRTHIEKEKVMQWLGEWYPAEVEGSDCKSIADIGNGKQCFIKLGAFSFDAVKFALIDHKNRVFIDPVQHNHSHITSIRFKGGTLNEKELYFSPELNTLIGIRGSGKSSILEVLRYVLEIPFGEKAGDQKYKQELVGFTLGSGGKLEIDAIDRYGQKYTVRRVWQESHSEVFVDGILQPGVSIRETVLRKPIYFGQKDLSSTGEGFEKDLVDKLLGSKLDDIRRKVSEQKKRVVEAIDRLLKVTNVHDQIVEQKRIKQDTEHRLRFYTEHGIEERLQKRLDFDNDVRMMDKGVKTVNSFVSDLESFMADHEDELRSFKGYESKHNSNIFEKFYRQYEKYILFLDSIKTWLHDEKEVNQVLTTLKGQLTQIRKGMVEEFAEIERKLAEELRSGGSQNISSDEFLNLKKKLNSSTQLISALEKQGDQKKTLKNVLLAEMERLNSLWLDEFNLIKTELDKLGLDNSSISIVSEYKGDKLAFLEFMKDIFRGSGIRVATYEGIAKQYADFNAIYQDFQNAQSFFGSNPQTLSDLFIQNLKNLLPFQTPNKFTITYRGKELQYHSLGQRASALILFVLSQKENDVIIIDQPEDDLDNQTIYEDVIKLIRRMKAEVQFIFATHNPNIPVLGDAELVHACSFMNDTVNLCSGSVDNPNSQKVIVEIMEGGKEAFDRRKEIYQIWKP